MENELATHLLILSTRFAEVRRLEESTVGRLAALDGRFFSRIREGKTFTAKKYDEVVAWFSAHWPEDAEWPANVARPVVERAA
ncbi:hypothetical protein ATER59S_02366 [Aquamicrobium terrae]